MIDYTKILNRKFAAANWNLNGDTYEGLEWLKESPKPTKEELDALWILVQEEIHSEIQTKEQNRQNLLHRLGITEEEAALLLS